MPVAECASPINSLLQALPKAEFHRVLAKCRLVDLDHGRILCDAGDRIRHVYFVNTGIVSLLARTGRGGTEVGMVGYEGATGMSLALGVAVSPVRVLVQGAGTAMRMNAIHFRSIVRDSPALQRALNRYLHDFIVEMAQTAACHRFHRIESRLARWLLMTQDRMRSDEFRLTQSFVADTLGVRRVGITRIAQKLQRHGMIRYSRGHVIVIDRSGLQQIACECYRAIDDDSAAT
ncbi:MAG: Crp/Fnr family transcriptional regulator [Burkholderiales bacterium]